jgi:hypothetical protein
MNDWGRVKVVRPGGLELPTFWFVARRSIQLSYGRADTLFTFNSLAQFLVRFQPRVSPHSHPINSKWLSKNCLHVRASGAAPDALSN